MATPTTCKSAAGTICFPLQMKIILSKYHAFLWASPHFFHCHVFFWSETSHKSLESRNNFVKIGEKWGTKPETQGKIFGRFIYQFFPQQFFYLPLSRFSSQFCRNNFWTPPLSPPVEEEWHSATPSTTMGFAPIKMSCLSASLLASWFKTELAGKSYNFHPTL